jgi:hypothetical protein
MTLALSLMSAAFAVVMAIPIVGPMLLAAS